jgi:hypothetical protein
MPIHKPIMATPENLRSISGELARCAGDLAAVADAIKHANFGEMSVTGYGQLVDAVKFANNFVAAGRNALYKARQDRGDFGILPPPKGQPKKHAVKKKGRSVGLPKPGNAA